MTQKLIDISYELSPAIAVWPGDTEFKRFQVMSLEAGDSVNVGSVELSVHCGTHADAPYHFLAEGRSIDQCELTPFIGRALVVDVSDVREILPEHLTPVRRTGVKRLLFKSGTARMSEFCSEFCHFSVEAAQAIAEMRVVLVGIDTPSVDNADSKVLEAHKVFGENGVSILENLNLADVQPGEYEIIALPLKIAGMDGSPVRAILRSL